MKTKIIVLMMFITTSLIFSQQTKTLNGKITDKNGNGITNVNITIAKLNKGVYTNGTGSFSLKNIQENTVLLKISKIGYATQMRNISLKSEVNSVLITLLTKTEKLDEVIVDGNINKKNKTVYVSNRLGVKSIDMPSSSDVVGKNIINEQQALSLGGIIANVSGVYQFNKGYGGVSETFGARGVSQRYTGFMFRDGTRFGTRQYLATPEIQFFEKVEFLKGAAAINFGTISPGATINYVTKKPFFETKGNVSVRYGSFNYIKPTVDYNFKLSEKLAYRMVSSSDMGESFRDDVKIRRYSTYNAFRYLANQNTTIDLNFDYQKDQRPIDFGLPIFEDRIITGFELVEGKKTPIFMQKSGQQRLYSKVTKDIRSRNINGHYNNRTSNQFNANLKLNSQLNENWNLNIALGTSLSDYDLVHSGSGFYNTYILQGDDLLIKRTLDQEDWAENTFGGQLNLTGNYNIFGLKNKSSISLDYDNRTQKTTDYIKKRNFDEVYLFNRNSIKKDAVQLDKQYLAEVNYTGIGIAFQNLLSITDHVKFLAAVRMDAIEGRDQKVYINDLVGRSGTIEKGTIAVTEFDDVAFSPTLGLTVKLTENNALFTSYTNSFNPNSRARLDDNDQMLPSYYTDQFEFGTKNSFLDNKLDFSAAYYIINDQGYVTSMTRPDRSMIGPGTKYKGIELDVAIRPIEGLSLSANYTNMNAVYNKGGYFKEGTRPQQTPEHQAGFATSYKVGSGILKGLSLNFDGQYTSDRLGNDFYRGNNPYIQKPYTMLNAGVGYTYKKVDVNLRVTNLLDEFVFFAYRYGSVNPIDPRQFSVTTRYRF